MPLTHDTGWFKSTSFGANDNCVEVRLTAANVGVRDSKDPLSRPFWVRPAAWSTFLTQFIGR
jgi:hypothetical protein